MQFVALSSYYLYQGTYCQRVFNNGSFVGVFYHLLAERGSKRKISIWPFKTPKRQSIHKYIVSAVLGFNLAPGEIL